MFHIFYNQVDNFNEMLQSVGKLAISELPLSDEDLEPLVDRYIEVLQELSTEIDVSYQLYTLWRYMCYDS